MVTTYDIAYAPAVSGAGARLTVAPDQALDWTGIAPRPADDPGDWVPAGTKAMVVPMPAEGLAAGMALSAIDSYAF